jgi:Tol biopolymer transport system component
MKKQIFILAFLLLFGTGLYAQPKAVGEPRVIAQMDEPLQRPTWSPDGTKLFFTSLKNNGLWEVSGNGSGFRQVSNQADAGKQLRSLAAAPTNPLLTKMVAEPAKVAAEIKGLQSLADYILFNPVLSPAGDKIVFQASQGKGLWICDANGSNLRSLGDGERATWTPDGKFIVVMITADDGKVVTKGELVSINLSSGARNTLLSSDKYIAFSPAISPDGKKLAFEEYASGAIYVMDIK